MSDPKAPSEPTTLLFHDGELADVRSLLEGLGTPFVERHGVLLPEDQGRGFDLAIATPQRMLDLRFARGEARPVLIAICDADSRSLRKSLSRAGIQLMVRRPVHPTVLRALVLHAIYRGPEKRRNPRVSIGAQIHFRAGWRKRPAMLADLSTGGCRLITHHPVEARKSITLSIPADVAGGKSFSIKARVLGEVGESEEGHILTATFVNLKKKHLLLLKRAISTHASGPATYEWQDEAPVSKGADAVPAEAEAEATDTAPAPMPVAEAPEDSEGAERRVDARRTIDRRVIALGEEATRVLMGRDISLGGMRVNPSPLLVVGEDVRLAIHVGGQELPLVVTAKVHRDDGDRGVVLRFHELPPDSSRVLNEMLDALPLLVEPGASDPSGMIVSEIIDDAPPAQLHTEAESPPPG